MRVLHQPRRSLLIRRNKETISVTSCGALGVRTPPPGACTCTPIWKFIFTCLYWAEVETAGEHHTFLTGCCIPSHVYLACMGQFATRDSGLLLTFDIPEGDQVSPFSPVIWLTWRRLLRWSADVCIELCNSFRSRFCKVSPQLCDGSTVIHDICSIVVVVVDWVVVSTL